MKENLWNLTNRKTRKTIEYIESLNVPKRFRPVEEKKFWKMIKKALTKSTANEMLKSIGYRYKNTDKIFQWCELNET